MVVTKKKLVSKSMRKMVRRSKGKSKGKGKRSMKARAMSVARKGKGKGKSKRLGVVGGKGMGGKLRTMRGGSGKFKSLFRRSQKPPSVHANEAKRIFEESGVKKKSFGRGSEERKKVLNAAEEVRNAVKRIPTGTNYEQNPEYKKRTPYLVLDESNPYISGEFSVPSERIVYSAIPKDEQFNTTIENYQKAVQAFTKKKGDSAEEKKKKSQKKGTVPLESVYFPEKSTINPIYNSFGELPVNTGPLYSTPRTDRPGQSLYSAFGEEPYATLGSKTSSIASYVYSRLLPREQPYSQVGKQQFYTGSNYFDAKLGTGVVRNLGTGKLDIYAQPQKRVSPYNPYNLPNAGNNNGNV